MHPEYPSSAAIVAGVSSGVLASVFGTGSLQILTVTDSADSRLQRQFNSIGQMAEEQRLVRIWGGIHFRNSLEVSEQMGRKLAEHLVGNIMTPIR
jgi:hypothetical protein